MLYRLLSIIIFLSLVPINAQASWFNSDEDEITPIQYSALLGLRDIDPSLFKDTLLPMIGRAMEDGKITVGELKSIESAAGSVAQKFYKEAKAPNVRDMINKAGSKIGDTLSHEVPKLFEDAAQMFRQKMDQPTQ